MNKTITLFIPCLVDSMYPEVGRAMVTLLEKIGATLVYPSEQTCCGQPAFNSGFRTGARRTARHFIRTFEDAA